MLRLKRSPNLKPPILFNSKRGSKGRRLMRLQAEIQGHSEDDDYSACSDLWCKIQ